ncbi:NAD(P)-binding protein, partial [Acephala macrosclerotiorum]
MVDFNINTEGIEVVKAFPTQVSGKTFLITGPSEGGVGAETALSLARGSPSNLLLLGRDIAKIQPIIDAIAKLNSSVAAKFVPIDLTSFSSVRTAASTILSDASIPKIDYLINNAAIMAAPYSLTTDGFESHLQTNHLSHFLLTNLLLSGSKLSPDAKIINVSSAGHMSSDIRYESTDFEKGEKYVQWYAYGQSKTANLLFTTELNKRFKEKGLGMKAFSPTPGAVDSKLQRFVTEEMREQGMKAWLAAGRGPMIRKSLQQGCACYLRAALDPSLLEQDLVFIDNCQPVGVSPTELSAYAVDEENAKKLWALSEEMVGEKFE